MRNVEELDLGCEPRKFLRIFGSEAMRSPLYPRLRTTILHGGLVAYSSNTSRETVASGMDSLEEMLHKLIPSGKIERLVFPNTRTLSAEHRARLEEFAHEVHIGREDLEGVFMA